LLIVLTASAVGILSHRQIEHASLEQMDSALEQQALFLRELSLPALLGHEAATAVQSSIISITARNNTRFTVIDAAGVVLADSFEDPRLMENHLARAEILQAKLESKGTAIRYSSTVDMEMLYVALPVKDAGGIIGYVRTALPLSAVDSELAALRSYLAYGVGIALLLSLPAGWYFTRRIIKPLVTMERAAVEIAAGDYGRQVRVGRTDEIGMLANALNRLSSSMADRIEKISRDQRQLEAMLGSMAEGIIATDREERIVHINTVAARLCRVSAGEGAGRKTWEVIRLPQITEGIRSSIDSGKPVFDELTISGSPRDQQLDMEVTPWRDSAGAVVGAVMVLHDVTRLKSLESLRREFLANASHELKSPVTAIRGLAETILDDQAMDRDTRERFIKGIQLEAMRLTSLLQDMLTISRLEQGEEQGEPARIDLRDVVASAVQQHQLRADTLQIELNAEFPALPVLVDGRQFSLETAVSNLISNGLGYTPAGGRVSVVLSTGNNEAVIRVVDTGIGIAPEHHDRIFERFYRVDKARSREQGGTGLGLSIVKHTVLSCGGRVAVTSQPGQGSVFEVCLPLAGGKTDELGI
jgi:two-component system, OmpR family, phosphate regulon sensor histidine kinase PhoR